MAVTQAQAQEISQIQEDRFSTRRETVEALEALLYQPIPLLDHGFIRVIDYMGSDAAIVQAARVSYGRGTKKVNEDAGLINYLMRHRHSTPFEMCEIKFHVKLPIFVARQWIRHRTANVNEYSGRYSVMDKEFYIPAPEQLAVQSAANRQGRGETLPPQQAAEVMRLLRQDAEQVYAHYEGMLGDDTRPGLARELARMNLTLNYYTQWYWKIDLHNLMHFVSLRADPHAQHEIRVYADAMCDILKAWVPFTYNAFEDYRLHGAHISGKGMQAIRRMLSGEELSQAASGMSPREWAELTALLQKK